MTRKLISTITGPATMARIYRDVDWNEYRVCIYRALPGDKPVHITGADYHTDDKADAMETAHRLVWPLAPAEADAVRTVRRAVVRWKTFIGDAWMSGNYGFLRNTDAASALQRLRNTYGPAWLASAPAQLER